ncbi:hypothetical protein R3P38DRAFT_3173711 [Favolaschia claudopus]|uniref:Uncharacterized protein n=1 Tax=Favolaschia claudopus TaxID=2862362 RepID=A0AAW0DFN8_9AGAR
MRCTEENVQAATTGFHSSGVMGFVSAEGGWFPYLGSTSDGVFILNYNGLQLFSRDDQRRALVIIRKYRKRGYKLTIGQQRAHACGISKDCPATERSNQDAGCALARFATLPPGTVHYSPALMATRREVLWDLGGHGCGTHRPMRDGEIERARCEQHCYDVWCAIAQYLLDMEDDKELVSESEEEDNADTESEVEDDEESIEDEESV